MQLSQLEKALVPSGENSTIREINTEYDGSAPLGKDQADGAQIEIVQWEDSEPSLDKNSGSSSVSLSHLMMGSTHGVKNSDR